VNDSTNKQQYFYSLPKRYNIHMIQRFKQNWEKLIIITSYIKNSFHNLFANIHRPFFWSNRKGNEWISQKPTTKTSEVKQSKIRSRIRTKEACFEFQNKRKTEKVNLNEEQQLSTTGQRRKGRLFFQQ
jgi:hypothetical protein